jgi:hypothetical protein
VRARAFAAVTVGISIGLMGCRVQSRTVDVSPTITRSPTCESAVAVYAGRSDVPSSYYELAWIETEGNSVWTTDNQMLQKMKTRAAAEGANGLIANPVQQNKVGVNILGEAVGAHTATAKASGLAIWMPAETDRTRLACGTR